MKQRGVSWSHLKSELCPIGVKMSCSRTKDFFVCPSVPLVQEAIRAPSKKTSSSLKRFFNQNQLYSWNHHLRCNWRAELSLFASRLEFFCLTFLPPMLACSPQSSLLSLPLSFHKQFHGSFLYSSQGLENILNMLTLLPLILSIICKGTERTDGGVASSRCPQWGWIRGLVGR